MTNSHLAVLIPWCDRPGFQEALARNRPWLQQSGADVLILNCAGDQETLQSLVASLAWPQLQLIRIPYPRFNKALALNLGIHVTNAEWIFTLDADVVSDHSPVPLDLAFLKATLDSSYVTVTWMHESDPSPPPLAGLRARRDSALRAVEQSHALTFYWADGSSSTVTTARTNLLSGSRAGAGLLLTRREHLAAVNGYNSALEHWGWEDNDVQFRLAKVLGLRHIEMGEVTHVSHGDAARAMYGESRSTLTWHNLRQSVERYAGLDFQGTLASDIAHWAARCELPACGYASAESGPAWAEEPLWQADTES